MFSFLLVTFQLLFVIMLGAFYRSSNFTSLKTQQTTLGLTTILGFILMSTPYRKLTLFSLILLLFITFLTIEANFMFVTFWNSCFTSFSNTVTISINLLTSSVFGALGVVITCLDFVGMFEYWQVFAIISVIMTIGYSLSSAVIVYGLDTYDGGCGVSVFLFSGMCSLMIWFLSIRGKITVLEQKRSQSYINYTLGFIGVCITFFSWPVLNLSGSSITQTNTTLSTSTSLSTSAYINTLCALGIPLLLSSFLSSHQTQSDKLHPKVYIECFINAGVVVASFQDVALHPVVGMTLALVATIVTVVVDKYLVTKTSVRNQSDFKMVLLKFSKILFRILWSFVGVCVGAIVVKTRGSSNLLLLEDVNAHGTKAGLMIAAWIIVLIIGLITGLLTSLALNQYTSHRLNANTHQKLTSITDSLFIDQLQPQLFPIYRDILQVQPDKTYEEDLTRRVMYQSLLQQQQIAVNIYQTGKKVGSHDTQESGKVQKETLVIMNDFSRSGLGSGDRREINLSAMKKVNPSHKEEPIAQQSYPPPTLTQSRTSVTPPADTPIKHLQPVNSRFFQSQRPPQNIAEKPKVLQPNPSSSKLGQIYVIEEESIDKGKRYEGEPEEPRRKLTFGDERIEDDDVQTVHQGVQRTNS